MIEREPGFLIKCLVDPEIFGLNTEFMCIIIPQLGKQTYQIREAISERELVQFRSSMIKLRLMKLGIAIEKLIKEIP